MSRYCSSYFKSKHCGHWLHNRLYLYFRGKRCSHLGFPRDFMASHTTTASLLLPVGNGSRMGLNSSRVFVCRWLSRTITWPEQTYWLQFRLYVARNDSTIWNQIFPANFLNLFSYAYPLQNEPVLWVCYLEVNRAACQLHSCRVSYYHSVPQLR